MKRYFLLLLAPVALWGACATGGRPSAETPEQVVRAFLAAAAAGDYAAAHACFAAPMKAAQPLPAFTETVRANAPFFQVAEVRFPVSSIDGEAAHLEGVLTLRSGERMKGTFDLTREAGAWKLRSYWFRA